MRKVFLFITMSFDGYIAGPNNELDWMAPGDDPENTDDVVALLSGSDTGLMGYPTAVGMIPYWSSAVNNPATSKSEMAIAQAISKIHGIVISNTEVKLGFENAELLVVKNDNDLIDAVSRLKRQPGRDMGIPGGVRTAQKFARLGLVDEYVIQVQPVAIGGGKPLFTSRVDLKLVSTKTYKTGVMWVRYQPR